MAGTPIADVIACENVPHMPDPAVQQQYAEQHGDRSKQGFSELTDIQVASRARMLMRDDWTHEAVCTSVRDRICALVLEKQALVEALEEALDVVECGGWFQDGPTIKKCEAALAKARGDQ